MTPFLYSLSINRQGIHRLVKPHWPSVAPLHGCADVFIRLLPVMPISSP